MIVQYVRERGYKGLGEDPHFTLGNNFIVLSILLNYMNKPMFFNVQREQDRYPCLVEAQFFDVVDPAIPPGWEFLSFSNDHFRLQPIEFSLDFWDEFHDGNESSEAMFNEVLMKLKDFHQMS